MNLRNPWNLRDLRDSRDPPALRRARRGKKRPPDPFRGPGGLEETVRAALLSRALERSIIAAGGLNGRVRDGNGCHTPAGGTNQRAGPGQVLSPCVLSVRSVKPSAAFPPCAGRPWASSPPPGSGFPDIGGGRRPGLSADQKRYGQRLAALAHPPCRTGGLPVAFGGLAARDGSSPGGLGA